MSFQVHAQIQSFLDEPHASNSLLGSVQRQTTFSLDVVSAVLHKYKISELAISYNGGKDCLVLLVLFLGDLGRRQSQQRNERVIMSLGTNEMPAAVFGTEMMSIPAIYVRPADPFPAVEDFVMRSAKTYGLSLTKFNIGSSNMTLRDVFEDYLADQSDIRAILVGTRRSDPHDKGWPDFVRIHPVIDWSYTEIWALIRHLGLEYCSLYNEGYTSLGGTSDTQPNPKLLKEQFSSTKARNSSDSMVESEQCRYHPAYELVDERNERQGRE
ncbi:hypothetical protein N7481_004884 [Penicillium waksmanii]|uniref:uncharacterized protein n=1 Tax=Penicillium waksmanii TaxID=69791 RepID=UPI0025482C19|nr:uncharacterized protein N7481_004884 [Penicillium waksmanii]KAJ5989674.1 hypothetical protein N7481_004884 [Penicillium waksmanii]